MNTILEQINVVGVKFVDFALPMLIQSVVLILILLLVDLALRKKLRAVFRYWIWLLVLLKLVLPTSLTSPLSLGHLIGDRLEYVDKVETSSEPKAQLADASPVNIPPYIDLSNIQHDRFTLPAAPIIPNTEPIVGTVISNVEPKPVKSVKASPPVIPLSWQGVVFLLWLAAVMAMSLLLLQRALFVMGLLRQACPANNLMTEALEYCQERMKVKRNVRLKVSFNATSPAVCGLFRPVILLPQNLGPTLGSSHLRTVIMHELAHIKRGDLWINTVQVVLQIFYLYNPLLWLANSIIRRVREQAVDETVLVAMGPKARQYPETLVNVARLAWQRPALSLRLIGVIESKSQLKERIKKMLERPAPKSAKLGIAGILLIIALGVFLLPMANAQNSDAETSKVSEKLKAEKQAEVKMLQDKINQLEKHLQQLQKLVQQTKSQITVVETKAKEQSDLATKEKQKVKEQAKAVEEKAKAAKVKAKAAKEKATSIEALKKVNLILKKMKQEEPQISELEQLKQLQLLVQKYQEKAAAKEPAKEKDKAKKLAKVMEAIERIKKNAAHVDKVHVVVAPKPMPMPRPVPVEIPAPPAPPSLPRLQKLPKLPKLPKIMPPPIPEMPVDGKSIQIVVPKIEPPQEVIQQISRVHTEKATLQHKIHGLHKELDERKEHDNISDEEAEKFEQEIEALEHKHEILEDSAEALEDRLEAWSEQLREQVANRYEKVRDQVRVKVESKHEQQRKLHEQQMQKFEQEKEQFERQHEKEFEKHAKEFERQMQQLEQQKEHLEHQKEQLERQKEHQHEKELEQLDRQVEQLEQQVEHEHEKELEQFERQMEQFEQQMEKWTEQHEHHMEQWSQKFNKEIEVSIEGLENELDNIDVEVNVEVDADADVIVEGSKDVEEKATFIKGPNILTATLAPDKKVIVKNRIGSINVTNGKPGQCTCSIIVKASAETIEQARQKVNPVKIEVDEDDEALNLVVVKKDNDDWKDIVVDLKIQVPQDSDILVNNDVGNLRIINLEGKIQGQTNVGDILATNLNGNIKLLTNVGGVVYEVPAEISAEVRGSTDVGKIKTELPLDVIKNFQKSQISGVLGKGESKVDLKTKVGNITIRKAKPPAQKDVPMN